MALEQAWSLLKAARTTIHCQNCRKPTETGSLIETTGGSKFWCMPCQRRYPTEGIYDNRTEGEV